MHQDISPWSIYDNFELEPKEKEVEKEAGKKAVRLEVETERKIEPIQKVISNYQSPIDLLKKFKQLSEEVQKSSDKMMLLLIIKSRMLNEESGTHRKILEI